MPKDLFFAIPEEKKNRILQAAIHEFSSRMYAEASINQIVKESDIARGSFYQYFEDKDDLYFYLIRSIIHQTAFAYLKQFLASQPPTVFAVYEALFTYNLQLFSDETYQTFFRNMYLGMDYHLQQKLKEVFATIREEMMQGKLQVLRLASGYDAGLFQELMNLLELNNRDLLMQYLSGPMDREAILAVYRQRIQILQGIHQTMKEE